MLFPENNVITVRESSTALLRRLSTYKWKHHNIIEKKGKGSKKGVFVVLDSIHSSHFLYMWFHPLQCHSTVQSWIPVLPGALPRGIGFYGQGYRQKINIKSKRKSKNHRILGVERDLNPEA